MGFIVFESLGLLCEISFFLKVSGLSGFLFLSLISFVELLIGVRRHRVVFSSNRRVDVENRVYGF